MFIPLRIRILGVAAPTLTCAFTVGLAAPSVPAADVTVSGSRRVWQPLTLDFAGPEAGESDDAPNPFLDYRLQVTFTAADATTYEVPGFFAGDGRGGTTGKLWRVRFAPDRPGVWSYRASFRTGDAVAVELNGKAGHATAFDGASGTVVIGASDAKAAGFYRFGRLEYVGKHYLKFRDGPYWLRGGTDSPENFLAYAGFDETPPSHKYAAHLEDWREGDPDWGGGRGRAIIGALNSLATQHVNSVYALTMNIGGDGKDVWPWAKRPRRRGSTNNDHLHYDNSKLAQWNTVFTHAQRKGIFLHLVLNEGEQANKQELDHGELGTERKLYYRELISRFGHHLAIEWNLCEEYNLGFDLGAQRIRAFADYIRAVDPYHHPITVHSAGDPTRHLAFTFGDKRFSLTSIQLNQRRIDRVAEAIRQATAEAGRPLPVSLDEFTVDVGQEQSWLPVDDADKQRKEKIWPAYFSGGMIEFILEGLLDVESFKTPRKAALWRSMWHARRFIEAELPFWEMAPRDRLSRGAATLEVGVGKGETSRLGAQVFCKPGAVFAIYLPVATSTGEIDLTATRGVFTQRWYDPRSGAFRGESRRVAGGACVALGAPPAEPEQDWVVLLKLVGAKRSTHSNTFPAASWQTMDAGVAGLDATKLDQLARRLGGRGTVVKDGRVVERWGDQTRKSDWYSAAKANTNDYLGIGSFGGGSDHFTKYGAGIYGFSWWFNATGRLHPTRKTWPDAPDDLVMAIGVGGNCCALLPSRNAVLVAAEADWGQLRAGHRDTKMNRVLAAFANAVTTDPSR